MKHLHREAKTNETVNIKILFLFTRSSMRLRLPLLCPQMMDSSKGPQTAVDTLLTLLSFSFWNVSSERTDPSPAKKRIHDFCNYTSRQNTVVGTTLHMRTVTTIFDDESCRAGFALGVGGVKKVMARVGKGN